MKSIIFLELGQPTLAMAFRNNLKSNPSLYVRFPTMQCHINTYIPGTPILASCAGSASQQWLMQDKFKWQA